MFDSDIAASASKWGVPESWIRAVIEVESNWNPDAYNPSDPGGARGLMQITGPTAHAYGVTDLDTLFDASLNIDLGTHILSDLRDSIGEDFRYVYSAYNSGKAALWETSAEVAEHVRRAMAALEKWGSDVLETVNTGVSPVGAIVLLVALWFLVRK